MVDAGSHYLFAVVAVACDRLGGIVENTGEFLTGEWPGSRVGGTFGH